ncbi:MAG TPA: branched-chain amino acid ABC transporter permease, partial [Burkholderiaceae bacterium]|nr:branched-chain amino acid ABC transporter permease [Burkholderiaceae bacterium]
MTARGLDRAGLVVAAAAGGIALLLPLWVETFTLVNLNVYVILSILALSMAWVWGVGGVLSFGQSVFFGLGAYAYAVASGNFGGSTAALLLAAAVPAAAGAALGYFLFYGRIGEVYLAVITLTVSLILFHLINTVAGAGFAIGSVPLGGYNGIPGVAAINVPGDPSRQLSYEETYVFSVAALILVYIALHRLRASRFGQTVAAIRENELRAELLGYDARAHKLGVFVIGAMIAGFAGALYAAWGSFIGPSVFGISFAAQIIIWAQ